VSSVGKALELLRLFDHPARAVRIGQASQALGVAPSTVHRMFSMFQQHGFVRQRAANKAYYAGEILLALAQSLATTPSIGDAALPELQRLVERTKETAYLSVMHDGFVSLVTCVESPLPLKAFSEIGSQFPAHNSASGRAMLAQFTGDELRGYMNREHVATPDEFRVDLDDIRRRGYSVRIRASDNIHAIARVVPVPPDRPRTAVVLTVPSARVADKRPMLVRELRRSTERLSTLLST
jgi:DNA-binding IclR family transcriptional regulator